MKFSSQQILASAIRILHEKSVLTKQIIDEAIQSIEDNPTNNDAFNKIVNSNLSKQSESVRLVHKPLSVEEISKLWSSYFQTNYRLSVAYIATVVLIRQ